MGRIKLLDKYFVPYISKERIEAGVVKVAGELNAKFANCNSENAPIFVSVLSGAYKFSSDIVSCATFPSTIAFVKISSYSGTKRTDAINVLLDINQDIKGKDIILIDEIVDSGNSVAFLKDRYLKMGAASVTIATMIYKPHSLKVDVEIDCYGIEMNDDAFVVGYGLDYDEAGRTLNEIYILDENQQNE